MSRMLALYPRAWRDRYGLEFQLLMAERPPSQRDRIDIVRGAIDARLHPQVASAAPTGPGVGVRIAGALGVLAGVLWVAASLAFHGAPLNLDLGYKESGSAVLIAVAAALVTGWTAVTVARTLPDGRPLMWKAGVAILVGAIAMVFPWPIVFIGYFVTLLGLLVFGLAGAAGGFGPSGLLLAIGALLAFNFNTEDERALLMIPLGLAWILVGTVLAVRGAPATIDSARLRAVLRPPANSI